jgi:hypothetical protein
MAEALNHTTGETWLSVATISKRTDLSESTVQRARRWLVEHGYFVPQETNRKAQVFTAGWKRSARKKHAVLVWVDPAPGLGQALSVRLATLYEYGVRRTVDLARKAGVAARSVQLWKAKYVTPVGTAKYVTPVQTTPHPVGGGTSSGTTSLRPSARSKRRERIRRALMASSRPITGDPFRDSEKYIDSEKLTSAIERVSRAKVAEARSKRPVEEWNLRDVIDEFRDQYKTRYPKHSPDELGNWVLIQKRLGKIRKDHPEVTVEVMHAAIERFWDEGLDKRRPDVPAWQKWLWKVRDTRPKRADDFYAQQIQGEVRTDPKANLTFVPNSGPDQDAMKADLARIKPELDRWESLLESGGPDELRLLLGDKWSTMLNYRRDRVANLQARLEEK